MNRLLGIAVLLAALEPAAQGIEVRGPATQRIAVFERPEVSGDSYAIAGSVACDGVLGDAYLEMWSEFPDGSRYFSRALEAHGSQALLTGTSEARAFALPFFLEPASPRPVRLEVNVVLPAGGRVVVSDLRLATAAEALATPGAWWSEELAGWIGGIAGSVVGLFGALVGILSSLGRGRRFVIGGLVALAAVGGVLLVAGLVALATGQPYHVWYPLLLLGVLDPVLALSLLPTARRRFDAIALHRAQALDAR